MEAVSLSMPWGKIDKLNRDGKQFALGSAIEGEAGSIIPQKEFSSYLTGSLDEVSNLIHVSEQKVQDFVLDPDSVDPHDVTMALAKANMSVKLTKQVVDEALKAYRQIISLR